MPQIEGHLYSPRTLRMSERFQKTTGSVGRLATRLVAGSSSPNYLQLNWDTVSEDVVADTAWVRFPGNPDAGYLMRRWRTAYLLSMKQVDVLALEVQLPDAVPAVAIRNRDLVQIGTHPDLQFGQFPTDRLAVAGREGRGPVDVTAGLYSAEHDHLAVPASLANNGVHITLPEFQSPVLSTIKIV